MRRTVGFLGGLCLLVLQPGTSAAQHWELTAFGGYNQGGNINTNEAMWRDAETEGALTLGGVVGFTYNGYFMLETHYAWRQAFLTGRTAPDAERSVIVDLTSHELHFDFAYHLNYEDASMRPYLLLGIGASLLQAKDRESETRLSLALGVGLKTWVTSDWGVRLEMRYHPTYITAEPGGLWCDPCVEMAEDNYLDELDFTAGLVYRLGGEY